MCYLRQSVAVNYILYFIFGGSAARGRGELFANTLLLGESATIPQTTTTTTGKMTHRERHPATPRRASSSPSTFPFVANLAAVGVHPIRNTFGCCALSSKGSSTCDMADERNGGAMRPPAGCCPAAVQPQTSPATSRCLASLGLCAALLLRTVY